ncbi:hypothetical protein [Wenjunlia tyrosinilytica]|uniref:hypothetical protein n=1 Tax=Wenjunlia tyrosinilytica TaxID=1544741 RepID=UPI0035710DFE
MSRFRRETGRPIDHERAEHLDAESLSATARAQAVHPRPGDALLPHTDWRSGSSASTRQRSGGSASPADSPASTRTMTSSPGCGTTVSP